MSHAMFQRRLHVLVLLLGQFAVGKSVADLFKEYLPLQLPPEEVRNGRKMTVISEPGADEAKGGLFGE